MLPKSFFARSEALFDNSKVRSYRLQNSLLELNPSESLFFYIAKIYEQENVSMSAPKSFKQYQGEKLVF